MACEPPSVRGSWNGFLPWKATSFVSRKPRRSRSAGCPSWPEGYHRYVYSAVKKGYSGTAVLTRIKPLRVWNGLGLEEHDQEGRVQNLEFDAFTLVNVYTPNAQNALARLDYRLEWDAAFLKHLCALREQKPVLFCGDLNVAHQKSTWPVPKKMSKTPDSAPRSGLLSID